MKFNNSSMSNHLADTIGYPRAMMIKLFNTTITSGTVLCTERPDNLRTVNREILLGDIQSKH